MAEVLAKVEDQYTKSAKLRKEDIKMLQEWAEKQAHLPEITELQLIIFLHSCNYHIEQAKTTIDNFFTMRTVNPDIFDRADELVIRKNLDVGLMCILPELTPDGDMVFFGKLMDRDPEKYVVLEQIKVTDMVMLLDVHLRGIVNGFIVIIDMEGFSFTHLTRLNLSASKRHIQFVQEALPLHLKQIHVLNTVSFMDRLMGMFKPFMKKELFDLMHFHTTPNETLYKFVPQRLLPQDLGGEAPSLKELKQHSIDTLLANTKFFEWLDGQKVDEKKRVGKSRLSRDASLGIDGSFKKLELD